MSVTIEECHTLLRKGGLPMRPPWAIAEWAFVARCDGCQACVTACREAILYRGQDGFPEVDFRFGGCDFCGACLAACKTGALRQSSSPGSTAFRYVLVIDDSCLARAGKDCRTCETCCDNYAIRFNDVGQGRQVPVVLEEQCNGCGACVGPCPVNSIQLNRPALPVPQ